MFIKEHLQELPSLEGPVPPDIASEFIDKFIMLKDSPNMVPSFLTTTSLNADQEQRTNMFKLAVEKLQQLVFKGDVFLVDASGNKCEYLLDGVYFLKSEAIHYLDKKGLLDRALSADCSWRNQLKCPESEGITLPAKYIHYGLPQELISMGIQEYRKLLILRKFESIIYQLDNLSLIHNNEKQFIEANSADIKPPAPMIESGSGLLESDHNLAIKADVVSPIQASSPPAIRDNSVESNLSKFQIFSENNVENSPKDNLVTKSGMLSASSKDHVDNKLIKINDVMNRLGVSRATIYNYINSDPSSPNAKFPKPLKNNNGNRWIEAEINAYIEELIIERNKKK